MKKLYCLSIFLLLLWSCTAPRVLTKISPEASGGHFAMGREYISLESDNIEVELAYDGMQGENLIFDFVVHNITPDTLSIQPADFYYVLLDSATAASSIGNARMAVHPEKVMMYYDQTLKERQEDKGVNSFLGILQAGAGIIYNTTAFIATDNPGFLADAVFHTLGTADQYISKDRMINAEMEMISEEKEVVEKEIFRMSRLDPESINSGYVYFPKHEDANYYMFCFPIENQLFQFVYNQRKEIVYY